MWAWLYSVSKTASTVRLSATDHRSDTPEKELIEARVVVAQPEGQSDLATRLAALTTLQTLVRNEIERLQDLPRDDG